MKTKILYLLLLVCSYSFSQTLPVGHYGRFEFTNGSLVNTSINGGPDLSGSYFSAGTDRNGNVGDALGSASALSGHTLGATNYNNTTLSFWLRNGSSSTSFRERIIQIYGTGGYGFKLEMNGGGFYLDAKASNGNVGQFLGSHTNIGDSQWHHIVVRTSAPGTGEVLNIDVFIDGVLQSNISGTIDPPTTAAISTFLSSAQLIFSPSSTYLGSLDDLYFYKSALTDAQILNIYNYTPVAAAPIIYYVDASATGSNDGSTWANAYVDLQSAITSINKNDEIWIAAGIYKPATSNRSKYFDILKSNISIYGGFAGTETVLSDRVLGSNKTILSGDLQGDDVNLADYVSNYANTTRNADNSYRIINILSGGDNLLLDGLTISDAHTNISTTAIGGAIYKDDGVANLTLRNCIVRDNVSRNFCGGLFADFSLSNTSGTRGALVIDRCQFTNNMSRGGSGIYSIIRSDTNIDITIANSIFDKNLAGDLTSTLLAVSGSGMWLRSAGGSSDAIFNIYNNTFVNNSDRGTDNLADDRFRAPLAIAKNGSFTNNIVANVANCIFWSNTGLGDASSTGGLTRAISDTFESPITSVNIYNSLDPLNFVDGSITNAINTVTTNPLFTDLANGDYSLVTGSPAIDSGNSSYIFGSVDILENQRIFNTTLDMGAYEFGSMPLSNNDFELDESAIKIYPNPSISELNIEMIQNLKQATIYTILGSQVLKTPSKTINTSNFKSGVYLIKIEDENGSIVTKRFIKQ